MNINDALIGFEFEFFTDLDNTDLVRKIQNITGKKTHLFTEYDETYIVQKKKHLNTGCNVILKYPIKKSIVVLKTSKLQATKAFKILVQISDFIHDFCITNWMTNMFVNISFNESYGLNFLQNIDLLNFCLYFDQELIYKKYPERRSSIFAKSIKRIIPKDVNGRVLNANNVKFNNYILPLTKFHAINFSKRFRNYLKFKYIGGENYALKTKQNIECIEYFINYTFEQASRKLLPVPQKPIDNLLEINKIYNNIYDACGDYESFHKRFPNIVLKFNLIGYNRNYLTSNLVLYRDKITKLLFQCNFRSGILNYDSTFDVFEIKDAEIDNAGILENCNIINSKISKGFILTCNVKNCNIEKCIIQNGYFYSTKIEKSIIEDAIIFSECNVLESIIQGEITVLKCKVAKSIIHKASLEKTANLDNETIILNLEKNSSYKNYDPQRFY